MTPNERSSILGILRANGVKEQVEFAIPEAGDELILFVSAADWMRVDEPSATRQLQDALHRKVWLTTWSEVWSGRTGTL